MTEDRVAQFEELILPHLDAAYMFARYLLRDEHDAQDAVQDASLRAFRHLGSYRGGDARAWFLVIVRNSCLSWRRRRWTDRLTTSLPDADHSTPVEPRSADATAIENSDVEAVRRGVADLPVEFREVLILRQLQELSYAEISTIVGIPIGTVMSRLSRARRALAERLGGVITREVG